MQAKRRPTVVSLLGGLTVSVILLDTLLLLRFDRQRRLLPALKRTFEAQTRVPNAVRSVVGYMPDGLRVLEPLPDSVRFVVMFVLHKGREQEEANFWQEVATVVADPAFLFVGCCNDRSCLSSLRRPSFIVVAEVPFLLGRTLSGHSANGHFIVIDRDFLVRRGLLMTNTTQVVAELKAIGADVGS